MKFLSSVLVLNLLFASNYNRKDWITQSTWSKARTRILARDRIENYWVCPYSGVKIKKKSEVDIDHIIPLKYAHEHCGDTLSDQRKRLFATDADNLLATSRHENRSKGDDGVTEYMPKNNQCVYLKHWKTVSKRYKLCLGRRDSLFIENGLRSCKDK